MAGTILKLGYTNPLTDVFGAHPTLGAVIDLNDGVTFTLASPDGLEMPSPPRTLVTAGNIRTQGEIATRSITRHNRMVTAQLYVGPSSSAAALIASLRNLLRWLAAPPQSAITLQYQPYNGSAPMYLDVVGAAHNLPSDEGQWLRGQFEPLTLSFVCRPGLRGDRITLQNLAPNAGFEQPAGGTLASSQPLVFNDLFANTNFYTALSAGNNYVSTIQADTPLRWYRLGESQGASVAADSGNQGVAGAYNASGGGTITQHCTGILGGGNDCSATLSGASVSNVTAAGSVGLPSGNGSFTLEAWVNLPANPIGSQARVVNLGTNATNQAAFLAVTTGGKAQAQFQGGAAITSAATLTLNVWHHLGVTWDGTTLTLYLDGVSVGTLAPGAANLVTSAGAGVITLASNLAGNGNWYAGTLDEVAVYGTALSAARLSAHAAAGPLGAGVLPTVSANQMTMGAGSTVTFGSPAWGAIAQWQIRFLYATGLTASFALHYVDASNVLYAQVTGTQLALVQTVGGVQHILATTSFAALTNGGGYFVQVTQAPSAPGEVALVSAVLSQSSGGAPGTVVGSLAPTPTFDGVTALSGVMGITASGAALVVGGISSTTTVNGVTLYGPGAWRMTAHATAMGSGAWEGMGLPSLSTANTYGGGPVASLGALRLDAPPSGVWETTWRLFLGGVAPGASPGTFAIPVPQPSSSQTFKGSVWVKTSGLASTGSVSLVVREYDTNGNQVRQGTLATVNGNQPGWVQLSGTYTTGVGTNWLDLACDAADTGTVGTGGSPLVCSGGASVWYDNAQLWNATQIAAANPGQDVSAPTSMPWCDLRAAVSPATLVVSGLLGDLPSPAWLGVGTYFAASPGLPSGGTLNLWLGRKGVTSPTARLVGVSYGAFSPSYSPQSSVSGDTSAYGGFSSTASVGVGGWNPRFTGVTAADAAGVYHLLARIQTAQTTPNLPNISLRVVTAQQNGTSGGWLNLPNASDIVGQWAGAYGYPFASSNTWTVADAGQCVLPPFPAGALTDPTALVLTPRAQWQDTSGASATGYTNWQALLPVDGSLVVVALNNPGNGSGAVSSSWLWVYGDGLLLNRSAAQDGPGWTWSSEPGPTPNPARGAGGAGTQSSGAINVNSGADPCLWLDPTLAGANSSAGVNQMVGVLSDQSGEALPLYAEVTYAPLYLEPR